MTSQGQFEQQVSAALFAQVGGFFSNTQRGLGFCSVCTAPDPNHLCGQCGSQRATFGDQLADQTLPLAYVRGWMPGYVHQSQHHVRQYKHPDHPSERCVADLQTMITAATYIHGKCIAHAAGRFWEVITFVPSKDRPDDTHPTAGLAQCVTNYRNVPTQRHITLAPGPSITSDDRRPMPDRFAVPDEHRATVKGKHVLVIDDTWVSGGKAQSAALTLKTAGASTVSVLCIARWLSHRWSEHRAYVETPVVPYNALICPVTGGACPT